MKCNRLFQGLSWEFRDAQRSSTFLYGLPQDKQKGSFCVFNGIYLIPFVFGIDLKLHMWRITLNENTLFCKEIGLAVAFLDMCVISAFFQKMVTLLTWSSSLWSDTCISECSTYLLNYFENLGSFPVQQ